MPEPNEAANSEANSEGAATGAAAATTEGQATTPPPSTKPADTGVSREAYSALQSRADKAEAEARRAREEAEKAVAEARRAAHEIELANLKPEERQAATARWNLEERERQLQSRERDLEESAKAVTIAKISNDYGIKPEELAGIDDVNELRARAAELKAERLQQELEAVKQGKTTEAATTTEETKPAQQAAPAGMRAQAPAAGSGGSASFDAAPYKGTGKVADYLRAKRQAGAEEVADVGLRRG